MGSAIGLLSSLFCATRQSNVESESECLVIHENTPLGEEDGRGRGVGEPARKTPSTKKPRAMAGLSQRLADHSYRLSTDTATSTPSV